MLRGPVASKTRILLVEDEAIVARDLKQRLEILGYEVAGTAASGREALALAETTRPELVFMDITIQGPIDGVETARRLTSLQDVPVVFLTAHMDTGTIQRAKQARPYGYLIKPLEEREIMTTIEMALSRHKGDLLARLMEKAVANAGVGVAMAVAMLPGNPITACNAALERMSGYAASEILGRSPWFLEGAGTSVESSDRLRKALAEGAPCQVTYMAYRKDGTPFQVDIALAEFTGARDDVSHLLLFYADADSKRWGDGAIPVASS